MITLTGVIAVSGINGLGFCVTSDIIKKVLDITKLDVIYEGHTVGSLKTTKLLKPDKDGVSYVIGVFDVDPEADTFLVDSMKYSMYFVSLVKSIVDEEAIELGVVDSIYITHIPLDHKERRIVVDHTL